MKHRSCRQLWCRPSTKCWIGREVSRAVQRSHAIMVEIGSMPRDTADGISGAASGVSLFRVGEPARRMRERGAGKTGSGHTARPPRTIGLMDHMGAGNLGDDTTQTAVIANIKERWPNAAIVGFTMNPPDTAARHGIQSYPLRRRTWDRPGEALGETPPLPERRSSPGRLTAAMLAVLRKPNTNAH